jgi:hypothetical protein
MPPNVKRGQIFFQTQARLAHVETKPRGTVIGLAEVLIERTGGWN